MTELEDSLEKEEEDRKEIEKRKLEEWQKQTRLEKIRKLREEKGWQIKIDNDIPVSNELGKLTPAQLHAKNNVDILITDLLQEAFLRITQPTPADIEETSLQSPQNITQGPSPVANFPQKTTEASLQSPTHIAEGPPPIIGNPNTNRG